MTSHRLVCRVFESDAIHVNVRRSCCNQFALTFGESAVLDRELSCLNINVDLTVPTKRTIFDKYLVSVQKLHGVTFFVHRSIVEDPNVIFSEK